MSNARGFLFYVLFVGLIISALLIRIIYAKHGLPYIYNYDEPATAGAALHILKSGDFNPHTFAYGSSLTYLYAVVDVFNFFRLMGESKTAGSYLTSLNDIHVGVVGTDQEWLWTISHPSFYFWDRMASVTLNIITILMTYQLAAFIIGSSWAALVAVAVLSSLGIFIEHSAYTTPDGPVTCFVVGTILFASWFQASGSKRCFLWSLVMTGLAAATKYNSALVAVVPAAALAARFYADPKGVDLHWIIYLFLVPAAVFISIMPFSLLDFVTFISDVGFEVRHYKVFGHEGNTSTPGIDYLLFQLHQFYVNIGFFNSVLAVLGFWGLYIFPRLRLVLLFPVIFLTYMSGMKVNFHRNFVLLYPLVAVLISITCYLFCNTLNRKIYVAGRALAFDHSLRVGLVVFVLSLQTLSSWITAARLFREQDSRSAMVAAINRLSGFSTVVLTSDLHVHEEDLKRLKIGPQVMTAQDIALCSTRPNDAVIVIPTNLAGDAENDEQIMEANALTRLRNDGLSASRVLFRLEGGPLFFNEPARSPGLIIVPYATNMCHPA